MTIAYTIGALKNYDKPETTYKGVGGSVWRTKEAVMDYFEYIEGLVTLHGESVEAGIYEVHLPNGWEEDTTSEFDHGEWRPLTTKAELGKRVS